MNTVADSIRRGLNEALAYAEGKADANAYRVHVPERIDVKAIRTKLDMTQEEFAGRFGFSVNTLRHWEQGSRQPEGPTAGAGHGATRWALQSGRHKFLVHPRQVRVLSLLLGSTPSEHAGAQQACRPFG